MSTSGWRKRAEGFSSALRLRERKLKIKQKEATVMHKQGIKKFPYYVGINSLTEIATREDRVCVLNITGNESSTVTPVSHEFSGGNIVFGTSPGRSGQVLPTKLGDIPVYNSVKEGIAAGHKFNTAVIYLPPSGVKDGVAEAVRHNPNLKKVIILTERISA